MSVAAIVLAAGSSSRFREGNKLLSDFGGEPLIRRVVSTVLKAGLPDVLVVLGHQAPSILMALDGLPIRHVENREHREGMGSSIAAGVSSATGASGFLIVPGDMPWLSVDTLKQIIERFGEGHPERIVAPRASGRQGNPVLFGSAYLEKLCAWSGNRGARGVLEAHRGEVVWVEVAEKDLEDLDE